MSGYVAHVSGSVRGEPLCLSTAPIRDSPCRACIAGQRAKQCKQHKEHNMSDTRCQAQLLRLWRFAPGAYKRVGHGLCLP